MRTAHLASLPVLFVAALGVAGCELIAAPDRSLIPDGGAGGVGGGGAGGVGGGGSGGGGTGGMACVPVDDGEGCTDDVCQGGLPVHIPLAPGAPCATGGGVVCLAGGACVECLNDTDCTGTDVCDVANVCVAPTCNDGSKNGTETDVDCGGSCSACPDGDDCLQASDCESGVCADPASSGTDTCQVPACGDGVTNGSEVCDDGNQANCDGCRGDCGALEAGCGDGFTCGAEACDDGNVTNGDGCDTNCTIPGCGNGVVTAPEACDDGNQANGDGCDTNCTATACGNGITAGAEACDDGNPVEGDGCDTNCTVSACGNGVVGGTEGCDDGNQANGDGCDDGLLGNCTVSACGNGVTAGVEGCDDANAVDGDGCDTNCTVSACGNGIVAGAETCEDGNLTNGDGCDDGPGGNCTATACGNGVVTGTEVCDDGNAVDGDGCDNNCTLTACGNGVVTGTEVCDDGDLTGGDGCDAACGQELGWICAGSPSVCSAICGDGLVEGTEGCDDGNLNASDGCDSVCAEEVGWDCLGEPSVCATICGDHDVVAAGGETCEDGAAVAGDGCSASCQVEPGHFFETEPNDDGALGVNVNDFSSANADGPFSTNVVIHGNVSPSGDDDVFAITNLSAVAQPVRFDLWSANLGLGVACGTTIDTLLHIRDAAGGSLANNDDRNGAVDRCSGLAFTIPASTTVYAHVIEFGDDAAIAFGSGEDTKGYLLQIVYSVCGDGAVQAGETCDDGDTDSLDGCSSTCQTEAGWTCAGTPSVCTLNCGNGTLQAGETCDDGNVVSSDGCSSACGVETGYVCAGTPSVCALSCGNGTVDGGDQCDDPAPAEAGDGCSATCTVEAGYQCTSVGTSTCSVQESNCNNGMDDDGDGNADAADPDCALPAYFLPCAGGETLRVYRSVDAAVAVPDSNATGVTRAISVPDAGLISRLAVLYTIPHTFDGDLDISLITPAAATLDICTDNGSSGANFTNTLLDTACVGDVTSGSAPFSGCFKPEASFATFAGTQASGQWKLKVADDAGGDVGTLQSWALVLCIAP